MIDVLRSQFKPAMSQEEKLNCIREFLQLMTLKAIHDKGWSSAMAFVGGTALRFLYDLRRFSEDLDFSLIQKDRWDFEKLAEQLGKEFELNGISVDTRSKTEKTVQGLFLRFPRLLYDLGLSPHKSEKLMVKLEVDTNPPSGGQVERSLVSKVFSFSVTHFDLPSLYAGKICACFYRKYIKGRDFYDFIWYLGKKIKPNYIVLNNAIGQAQGKPLGLGDDNIQEFLLNQIKRIDFKECAKDVDRFLEDKGELKLFDKDLIENSIRTVFKS